MANELMQQPNPIPTMFDQLDMVDAQTSQMFSNARSGIDYAMKQVTDLASNVGQADYLNTDAIIGEIEKGYADIQSGITNAALRSVNKQMLELDSYLGSSSSDARAAVRFRMAGEVTNNLMSQAFMAVAEVREREINAVVGARVNIAQVNTGVMNARTNLYGTQAQAITSLAGQQAQLYASQAGIMTNLATARLDAANAEANRMLERENMAQNYSLAVMQMEQQDSQFVQSLRQDEKQFAQKLGYDYDSLSQQERQFVSELAYKNDALSQDSKQFAQQLGLQWEELFANQSMFNDELMFKKDSFLSQLGLDYDKLNLQSWQFDQELAYNYDVFSRELDYKYDAMLSEEAMRGSELGFKYDSLKQQWEELLFKVESEEDMNDANRELTKWLAEFEQENKRELQQMQSDAISRNAYVEAGKNRLLGSGYDRETKTVLGASGGYTYSETKPVNILTFDEWMYGKKPEIGQYSAFAR